MTEAQIKTRRLEIALAMASLGVKDCELRGLMLEVEAKAAALTREVAELDLKQSAFDAPLIRTVKRG